jgi:exodeoxyribonuclease V gamma subunit
MAGSGIRWGLDEAHRENLGLSACGDQNTGWFGLRRMLLGYAAGGGRV